MTTPPGSQRELGPLDLAAGAAILLLALLGWVSLALADAGAHSLPAVLVVTAVVALGLLLLVRRFAPLPPRRRDRPAICIGAGVTAVAAALTFPGFSYGVADKDPGGYVSHAVEIARTGGVRFVDPLLARGLDPQLSSPAARFPGIWVRGRDTIVPQFFHLWPSLLATAHDVAGMDGIRYLTPVPGVVAVLCLAALLYRVGTAMAGRPAGLLAAAVGGLLLATNMMEVWQARYPTTEVMAEALYLGALLAIVVALQTGSRAAAGAAGLLVGVGWLNRADAVLLVLLLVLAAAALLATRRFDARAGWAAAGLAAVLPHALLQAYWIALPYSRANGVPSLPKLAAGTVTVLLVAWVLRRFGAPVVGPLVAALARRRVQLLLGGAVCLSVLALLVLGLLRSRLFGWEYFNYNGRRVRSYDEAILRRLGWFFTLPGYFLFAAGVGLVALRRWRPAVWAAVLPTLLLFPLYGYSARNSTRLMWWSRRYVPTVLPGVLLVVALTLAFAWVVRIRGRAWLRWPAAGLSVFLLWAFLGESLPLRSHDEWRGSLRVTSHLARLAGGHRAIYLWDGNEPCCDGPAALFAVPVWLQRGQLSVLLPTDPSQRAAALTRYRAGYPGWPLLVVSAGGAPPPGVPEAGVRQVDRVLTSLPIWEETQLTRPARQVEVVVDLSVWRVVGT